MEFKKGDIVISTITDTVLKVLSDTKEGDNNLHAIVVENNCNPKTIGLTRDFWNKRVFELKDKKIKFKTGDFVYSASPETIVEVLEDVFDTDTVIVGRRKLEDGTYEDSEFIARFFTPLHVEQKSASDADLKTEPKVTPAQTYSKVSGYEYPSGTLDTGNNSKKSASDAELKVNDKAKYIGPQKELFGRIGTIKFITSEKTLNLDIAFEFDPTALSFRLHDCSGWCKDGTGFWVNKEHLVKTNEAAASTTLQVGDLVEYAGTAGPIKGKIGIIRYIDTPQTTPQYAVDFKESNPSLHSCSGHCRANCGYWAIKSELIKLYKEETPTKNKSEKTVSLMEKDITKLDLFYPEFLTADPTCPKCNGTGVIRPYPTLEPTGMGCSCRTYKRKWNIVRCNKLPGKDLTFGGCCTSAGMSISLKEDSADIYIINDQIIPEKSWLDFEASIPTKRM